MKMLLKKMIINLFKIIIIIIVKMVKINNKNIKKVHKNIPEFILDGNTKDNNIDDLCNDLSRIKLKKNKTIHSLKIKSNINKCTTIIKFRKDPIFCIIKINNCERCGRPGHYASTCYAKKDINGDIIIDESSEEDDY